MQVTPSGVIFYIAIITIVILVFLIYIYIQHLNKIVDYPEILQKDNPTYDEIQDLLVQKQPTIFADVLYEMEAIAEIFDMSTDVIYELLDAPAFVATLNEHFDPYSLLFSRGWKYHVRNIAAENKHTLDPKYFRLEGQHRHLIAQITGAQRVLLASPNQTTYLNPTDIDRTPSMNTTICTVDFNSPPEGADFNKLQYIEIILREGNLLYIPRGWWYLQTDEEDDSLVLEAVNSSLFS